MIAQKTVQHGSGFRGVVEGNGKVLVVDFMKPVTTVGGVRNFWQWVEFRGASIFCAILRAAHVAEDDLFPGVK